MKNIPKIIDRIEYIHFLIGESLDVLKGKKDHFPNMKESDKQEILVAVKSFIKNYDKWEKQQCNSSGNSL